jgi:hypothetical protein
VHDSSWCGAELKMTWRTGSNTNDIAEKLLLLGWRE